MLSRRLSARVNSAFPPAPATLEEAMAYSLKINGTAHSVDVDDDTPLLWVIRDVLGMTGTKFGCGQPHSVVRALSISTASQRAPALLPVDSVGDSAITTIEAIGETPQGAALQKAWLDLEVVQCGYCQSGQLMSAAALLKETPKPTDEDIDSAMSGNVCRCGTYQRIRAAIKQAAEA